MDTMDFKGPGFRMRVPTDWYIMSSPQFQVMFIAPPVQEGMRANLMITMHPVEEGVSVQNVARQAGETQEKEYPEYQVIQEGELENTGGHGYTRTYRWQKRDINADILQRQVMFVVNRMYLTLTTTRQDAGGYEEVDQAFDTMISSFEFV